MKLSVEGNKLKVRLEGLEKLLALKGAVEVPLELIERVSTEEPARSWRDIRAPGTYIPKLVRAGTYYTPRGKEFWYVTRGRRPLVIELRAGGYKRIVLGLRDGENERWKRRLEALV